VTDKEADLISKTNIVFSGTMVVSGSAVGIVVRIGMKTEIGKV